MFSRKLYKSGLVVFGSILFSVVLLCSANNIAEARDKTDVPIGFHFALAVQGAVAGYFTECSGMGSENEVIEHRVVDSNGNEVVRKIAGRLKWPDITCQRGITSNLDIWNWRKQVEEGGIADARQNGSMIMYNQNLEEVARWNFTNAWPSKVIAAANNNLGLEEVTIVHEGLVRVN